MTNEDVEDDRREIRVSPLSGDESQMYVYSPPTNPAHVQNGLRITDGSAVVFSAFASWGMGKLRAKLHVKDSTA